MASMVPSDARGIDDDRPDRGAAPHLLFTEVLISRLQSEEDEP
jgi:hypothetical protein